MFDSALSVNICTRVFFSNSKCFGQTITISSHIRGYVRKTAILFICRFLFHKFVFQLKWYFFVIIEFLNFVMIFVGTLFHQMILCIQIHQINAILFAFIVWFKCAHLSLTHHSFASQIKMKHKSKQIILYIWNQDKLKIQPNVVSYKTVKRISKKRYNIAIWFTNTYILHNWKYMVCTVTNERTERRKQKIYKTKKKLKLDTNEL